MNRMKFVMPKSYVWYNNDFNSIWISGKPSTSIHKDKLGLFYKKQSAKYSWYLIGEFK